MATIEKVIIGTLSASDYKRLLHCKTSSKKRIVVPATSSALESRFKEEEKGEKIVTLESVE